MYVKHLRFPEEHHHHHLRSVFDQIINDAYELKNYNSQPESLQYRKYDQLIVAEPRLRNICSERNLPDILNSDPRDFPSVFKLYV
jgi:hypothetical protein